MNLADTFLLRLNIAYHEFVSYVIQPPWTVCVSQEEGSTTILVGGLEFEIHCLYPTIWRELDIELINVNACLAPFLIKHAHVAAHSVSKDVKEGGGFVSKNFLIYNVCVYITCKKGDEEITNEFLAIFCDCLENAILFGRRG